MLEPLPDPCQCGHDRHYHRSRQGSHGRSPCVVCDCPGFRIASRAVLWQHLHAWRRRVIELEADNRRLAARQHVPAGPYLTRYSATAAPGIAAIFDLPNRTRVRLETRSTDPLARVVTAERFDAAGQTRGAYAVAFSPGTPPLVVEAIASSVAALELEPPDEATP